MTKLIVVFRNFAKTPKNSARHYNAVLVFVASINPRNTPFFFVA